MIYKLSDFDVSFEKGELNNGINIFSFFRQGMPICVRFVFFAGSRFDSVSGTSHFLEHMMVAGTKKFQSKDKLAWPLEKIGGSFSASTSMNFLRFNTSVPQKEDFATGLEILEEITFHTLFDDKVLETERGSIISEIGQYDESPDKNLLDIYNPMIFSDTYLTNNVLGSRESVNSISKNDLIKFKDNFLRSGRMAVFISGGIRLDESLGLLNKSLSGFKEEKRFDLPEEINSSKGDFVKFAPWKDNKRVYIKIGFRASSNMKDEDEAMILALVSGILGKGRTSRLIKELRYQKGLVYSVSANYSSYPDAGHFMINTSCDHDKLNEVVQTIINDLKKIEKNGVTEEELDFIKSASIKGTFNIMQTSWSWIDAHYDSMIFNQDNPKTLDYHMNKVNTITLDQVNKVIKKYINKDNFHLALLGTNEAPIFEY